MGFNAKSIGYDSAEDMIERFKASESAQLDGMVRFVRNNGKLAQAELRILAETAERQKRWQDVR